MSAMFHEEWAIVSTIDPANINNATTNGDYVDMTLFHEVSAVLILGAIDSTVDFSLRNAKTTGGAGEVVITGKTMTQLTGGTQDNEQHIINCRSDELTAVDQRYIRPRVIMGAGTTNIAAVVIFGRPRHGPGTDNDLASVTVELT